MRRARPLLGTIVEITAEGADDVLPAAIEEAFASIEQVQRLMNFHDPNSDVSHINDAETGQGIIVDPQTLRVLRFAHRLSYLSEGLFDVTTASTLVVDGFLPERTRKIPDGATYLDLLLLPGNCVLWRRKGCIDLGGIAKGYAVDCAIATLRSRGVASAIVNAGGDLRCFGTPRPIYLRHPDTPAVLMYIGSIRDAAFATSAGYFSRINNGGREIEPLVDPRRGECVTWKGSVSVAAPDGMTADALTKIVALAPDFAVGILDHFDAQAIVIDGEEMRCCGHGLLQWDIRT